jgi:hypothetical protein
VKDDRLKLMALILGFALWAALGYLGKVPLDPLIALLQMGLGGLITHMLQGGSSQAVATSRDPVAPSGQAGRSLLELLIAIAVGVVLFAAAGCSTQLASMYKGAAAQTKAGIEMFDDNTMTTMRDLLCAQPYSAIQRHPEMQAAIQQLCGPLANATSLDAGQLQLLMNVVGKAQAAGLLATPAAAAASGAK